MDRTKVGAKILNELCTYSFMRFWTVPVLFTLCFLFMGCHKRVGDTPIQKTPFAVDRRGVTFRCDPPLKRYNNTATVRIGLKGNWTAEPPWDAVEFADGRRVQLEVILTSVAGENYTSAILGRAGGMLDVRFNPPIPKEAEISQVQVFSDAMVQCTEAVWHDYQAK